MLAAIILTPLCSTAAAQTSGEAPKPEQISAEVKAPGEPEFDPARKQESGYLDNYKREQHVLHRLMEYGISWPQYHKGDGSDSEFSNRWVVGSAATMFLLDKNGRCGTQMWCDRLTSCSIRS